MKIVSYAMTHNAAVVKPQIYLTINYHYFCVKCAQTVMCGPCLETTEFSYKRYMMVFIKCRINWLHKSFKEIITCSIIMMKELCTMIG